MTVCNMISKFFNKDKITLKRCLVCFSSEFLATFVLLFVGCMSCVEMGALPNSLLHIVFCFGFAILISVQCFGHISGSNLNPAVSLAAVLLADLPPLMLPLYIVAQTTGAVAGFGTLWLVTPNKYMQVKDSASAGVCSPMIHRDMNVFQALVVEFILTGLLVMVCGAIWDVVNRANSDGIPTRFGLTIVGLALAGVHYTGAHMNPARSFAPALINGDWKDHWVYWVGPLAGSACASLFYRFAYNVEKEYDEALVGERNF